MLLSFEDVVFCSTPWGLGFACFLLAFKYVNVTFLARTPAYSAASFKVPLKFSSNNPYLLLFIWGCGTTKISQSIALVHTIEPKVTIAGLYTGNIHTCHVKTTDFLINRK